MFSGGPGFEPMTRIIFGLKKKIQPLSRSCEKQNLNSAVLLCQTAVMNCQYLFAAISFVSGNGGGGTPSDWLTVRPQFYFLLLLQNGTLVEKGSPVHSSIARTAFQIPTLRSLQCYWRAHRPLQLKNDVIKAKHCALLNDTLRWY